VRLIARTLILVVSLNLALSLAPTSFGAVRAGASCPKVGQIKAAKGTNFKCIQLKGKKAVWRVVRSQIATTVSKEVSNTSSNSDVIPSKSETSISTSTPDSNTNQAESKRDWSSVRSTDEGFLNDYFGWCSPERDLEGKLKQIETAFMGLYGCSGIYRIAQYRLGNQRPQTSLSSNSVDLPLTQCQISEPSNSFALRGFQNLWSAERRDYTKRTMVPGPQMVVQVIPIFTSDSARPIGRPGDDYDVYFDFLKDWAKYSADGESRIEIRVPSQYLKFSREITSYKILHENRHDHPEHVRFVTDLVREVDPLIDFSGTNLVLVVVPPGTPLTSFHQGTLKSFMTQEGRIEAGSTMYPLTLEGLNQLKHPNFLIPFWFPHELYHSGAGLDDHYGDGQKNLSSDYGLGEWTMMTPWGGDLSAWEKWFIGFITDSQVHCIDSRNPTVRWIAPSSVKTREKKLIVIPLSQTKGVVIESIRPAGLYYKIPTLSNGVLVYSIDLEIQGHGKGLKLVLPTFRNPDVPPFFLSQATLREGESVQTNGLKITVMESGNFGDVIKVER
jgi:hypothetical protein